LFESGRSWKKSPSATNGFRSCQDRRQEIETITKFVLILTLTLKTENRDLKSFDIRKFEEMPLVQVQQFVSVRVVISDRKDDGKVVSRVCFDFEPSPQGIKTITRL
jgi:hypothetical protein